MPQIQSALPPRRIVLSQDDVTEVTGYLDSLAAGENGHLTHFLDPVGNT
jgi:hypothetical protein